MVICDFGCGKEAIYRFKNGRWCCCTNTNSCEGKRLRDSNKKKGKPNCWKNGHPRGMKGKPSPFKGKTFEEIHGDKANDIKNKISERLKGNDIWTNLSEEQRSHHAERARTNILNRYEQGWMPKAGRCKKYSYSSHVAGDITVDGTWELVVAKWLDAKGLVWKRNTKRFPYNNLNGTRSHYTPDFWIEDWNAFLEVKGYETDLDRCKWSQFHEKLIIWKKDEIIKITKELASSNPTPSEII